MNGRFRRNTLLANAALVLLCYVRGVMVNLRCSCELLGGETHCHCIPELVLALPLPKSHKRTPTKNQFSEIERNIKALTQRCERCPFPGNRRRSRSRKLGQE
jgi:hypothetical protein